MDQQQYGGAYPPSNLNPGTILQLQGNQSGPIGVGSICPQCQAGILVTNYTACGIFLAILCSPIGTVWCWMTRKFQCKTCGYSQDS